MGEDKANMICGLTIEVGGDMFLGITKGQTTPCGHEFIRCNSGNYGAAQWNEMRACARRTGDLIDVLDANQAATWNSWSQQERDQAVLNMGTFQPPASAFGL